MKLWVICILECVIWVIQKIDYFMWKYIVLVKIRKSLLCATNRWIKVTSKSILPSVSRFKFCPHCISRENLIFTSCNSITISNKTIKHLMTVLKLITMISEQYCLIYFGFLYFHQRNSYKLVCSCCDGFEQVNSGRLTNMLV